jgi:GNAT superfamily N-acetyltransferase
MPGWQRALSVVAWPELRAPKDGEWAALSALCLRSKAHWGYDPDFIEACRAELTITPGQVAAWPTIVAGPAGGPASGLAQFSVEGDRVWLEKLFVDPGAMGRGIGRALFTWAIDAARERGGRVLVIEADPQAVPFYQRLGAVPVGHAPSASIPGRALPVLHYSL